MIVIISSGNIRHYKEYESFPELEHSSVSQPLFTLISTFNSFNVSGFILGSVIFYNIKVSAWYVIANNINIII